MSELVKNLSKEKTKFQEEILGQLEDKDAIEILHISVGHIFDALYSRNGDESYTNAALGYDVTLETISEPDGVSMVCQDYDFEFDLLSKPMITALYFRNKVVTDNPELVKATAAMLEVTKYLFNEIGISVHDLSDEWDG